MSIPTKKKVEQRRNDAPAIEIECLGARSDFGEFTFFPNRRVSIQAPLVDEELPVIPGAGTFPFEFGTHFPPKFVPVLHKFGD
jgi:hypothetical protein